MSSIYNPNGTLPTPPSNAGAQNRFNILSSTNASPIVVTFASSTGIQNGDTIEIEGHLTNTAANGLWVATLVSGSTVYSLNGSTGNGVGGNTGWATDYTLNPLLTIPSDGDLINAATVNTPIEGISNAIPFLYRGLGKYRFYDSYTTTYGTNSGGPPVWSTTTTGSATYVACTSATGLFGLVPGPALIAGDALDLSVDVQFAASGTSQDGFLALGFSVGGGGYTASTEEVWVPETSVGVYQCQCHTFRAFVTIGGTYNNFDIAFMCRSRVASSNVQVPLLGVGRAVANHYRST